MTNLSLFQPDLLGLLDRNPRLGVKILLSLSRLVGIRLVEVSDELETMRKDYERLKTGAAEPGRENAAAPDRPPDCW